MAFAETDRVQIRRWLGYAPIWTDFDPTLENAMVATQATTDGGAQPDNSTELAIRAYLTKLTSIEAARFDLIEQMQAFKLEELTVDPVRALAGLAQIGRTYVGHISDALSTPVKRDVFSAPMATG